MKRGGIRAFIAKVLKAIASPRWYVALITALLTAAAIGASIFVIVSGQESPWYYALYFLSAVLLALTVRYAVIFAPIIKARIIGWLDRYRFTSALIRDVGFRALTFTTAAFIVNIAYAIFNGVLGIIGKSVWYGSLSLYYLVLSALKGYVIYRARRAGGSDGDLCAVRTYRNCGVSLILLGIALIGPVTQMIISDKAFMYADLIIYFAAFYAFYKLTLAIVQFVKSRRRGMTMNETFGLINLSDGLVSMLALQTALLTAFGEGADNRLYNIITGTAVLAAIIIIGIYMIFGANRIKGRAKK